MRRILILATLLPLMASAQVFNAVSLQQVKNTVAGDVRMTAISHDGRYAYVTSNNSAGLRRINLSDGSQQTITDKPGAGIQPVVSADGEQVLYTTDTFDDDKLRRTAVCMSDLHENSETMLTTPVRNIQAYRFSGSDAIVMAEGRLTRRQVSKANRQGREALADRPTVMSNDLRIQLIQGDQTTILTPNGDDEDTHYIWASLSPDGQHILYYVSDEGAYVCNLQGQDVQFVAVSCLAPQWYDDNTIVGMDETDDGQHILTSAIVAYTLDGARQQLTDPELRLMYPYCSAATGRIVCSSITGELYQLNISK